MTKTTVTAPIATNVTIIGELMPGGTIRGSYKYIGTGDETEEGGSLCRWYIGESPGSLFETFDLAVKEYMVGKTIRFAITPKSKSGVSGIEVYSQTKLVVSGYQNISEEESQCSFIKQYGAFSLYRNEPNDRILTSTSGAFALMSGSTQSVVVRGRTDFGGAPPVEIAQYLKNNPATRMFSTAKDFAALVPVIGSSNQLLMWGNNIGAIPPQLDVSNIKYVYSNETAVAWIYDNPPPGKNTIGAFGNQANGGLVPDAIQMKLFFDKPKAIYATASAFAVLTEGGRVYAWGQQSTGGLIPAATQTVLDQINITSIVCTAGAFCAVGPERFGDPAIKTIAPWGASGSGGALNPGDLEEIMDQDGAKHVLANRDSFVIITKRRSKALSWGGPYGGVMNDAAKLLSARGNIVMCAATAYAFCMINSGGEIAAWGVSNMGGSTPTSSGNADDVMDAEEVLEASGAKAHVRDVFKAIDVEGWYQKRLKSIEADCLCHTSGERRSSLSYLSTASGDITISSNDSSFFLSSRGTGGQTIDLIVWGTAGYGGTMSSTTRQVLMASQITDVYSTNGAYAVISNQGGVKGAVTVFGGSNANQEAGEVPAKLQNHLRSDVEEVYSLKQMPPYTPSTYRPAAALSARLSNGHYVIWGGATLVTNEVLDPADPERSAS